MIYLGADHAGFDLKEKLKKVLAKDKIAYKDLTPVFNEKDDYPDAASVVGKRVAKEKRQDARGVLFCGTGMGICMAANKIKGIRGAVVYSLASAKLAKEHNDANIICFGGRTMDINDVERNFMAWHNARFDPEQRHKRRIAKMDKLR